MTYQSVAAFPPRSQDLWRLGTLPLLAVGLLFGLLGVYWDIAWHIDKSRDSFFSPPHNFIYGSMLIVLLMSIYTLLRDRRASPYHLKVGKFSLHPGILLVALGAALELLFAPADDLWHRLYGAEISLWAPMHLIGLLSLSVAALGAMVTAWLEAKLNPQRKGFFSALALYFCAIFLGWTMLYLAEYAYGTPSFPMWLHVCLLVSLPALSLWLATRLQAFRLSATIVALIYTLMHLLILGMLSFTHQQLDWAGATQPLIANVMLTALLADWLNTKKGLLWLKGLALAGASLLGNWLLFKLSFEFAFTQTAINWHPQALMLGVPVGLILAVIFVYGAERMAKSLRGYGI